MINNAKSLDNTLTVSIQNQEVRYEDAYGKCYFCFDVYINANNNSTFLDNVVCRLNYNTQAFGTNIAQNNKITVTNGTTFSSATYSPTEYVYDISSNCLNLGNGVGTVLNPVRTRLTTTPVELLKVKIELNDNLSGVNSNLSFTDIANASMFSMFTTTSNSSWQTATQYDAVYYSYIENIIINTLRPQISNFSPVTMRAGLGEIITINGTNFGTQPGRLFLQQPKIRL
jgi:hypothetical protein